eukprot:c493_g1_i2.p1 GENE.c493_g1_i2~~c493_g1_i2.p1  ORF type:complete len:442 (+),score=139.32 c493_g1_i2:36-1328(+)
MSQDKKEVLIDGRMYDVSKFNHPGGSIINYLVNEGDATEAFQEFHSRSHKAQLILKSLPSREATKEEIKNRAHNGKPKLTSDFAKLRKKLVEEGYFDPSVSETVYRVSELIFLHVVGLYLFSFPSFLSKFIGLAILGIAEGRCGWLMHEGGHFSMTTNIIVDKIFQVVLFGFGCGMSGSWWRNQHNKHHATPQKLQHDVDLDTLPLVAFNSAILNNRFFNVSKSPILRVWLRFQGALFIPISCLLVALGWQFFLHPRHIYRLLTSPRSSKQNRMFALLEATMLVLRFYLMFGVVFSSYSWSSAIGCFLFYDFIGASYIFTNFSLSHTHLPVSDANSYLHWVDYASKHTINITPGIICTWWMAYLNFQIEHHLFPSMPQFRHPKISPLVREMFENNGLVYDSRPYFSTLGTTLKNLNTVGIEAYSKKNKQV